MFRQGLRRRELLRQINSIIVCDVKSANRKHVEIRDCGGPAGRRVYAAEEKLSEGTVVTFYPGTHYPAVPIWATCMDSGGAILSGLSERLQDKTMDDSYLLTLIDAGGAIDGFPCKDRGKNDVEEDAFCSLPLSLMCGHLMNHPNPGELANMDVLDFLWHDIFLEQQSDYKEAVAARRIPNALSSGLWVIDPSNGERHETDGSSVAGSPALAGVGMVTTRDVMPGEELLLDYKLQSPHPPWYTPVS